MSMSDQKWSLATVTSHPSATVGGREGAGNSLAWCPGADRLSCFPSHARRSHRVPPPAMSTDCPEMARGLHVGGEQCWGRPPISPLSPLPAIRLLSRQVYLSVKKLLCHACHSGVKSEWSEVWCNSTLRCRISRP